tara:strand:- start:1488 stop:1667 length:180 start_codon:yes stop_codon:yes gene_type:complete
LIKSNDKIYLSNEIYHFKGKEENGLDRIIVNCKIGDVKRNGRKVGSYIEAGSAEPHPIT